MVVCDFGALSREDIIPQYCVLIAQQVVVEEEHVSSKDLCKEGLVY